MTHFIILRFELLSTYLGSNGQLLAKSKTKLFSVNTILLDTYIHT